MNLRTLAVSGLAAASATLALSSSAAAANPTCKVPADMSRLIPADAQVAADLDVDGLTKTQLWKDSVGELQKDRDFQQIVAVLGTCGIKLADMDHATVGFSEQQGDRLVFALEAPGIGKSATTSCLATQVGLLDGHKPTFKQVGCATEISFEGDEARVYALDADHVVMVSEKWAKPVMAQVNSGKGSPLAVDMGKQRSGSHIRFAVQVDDSMRASLGSTASSLQRISGSMSFGNNISASVSGELGSTAAAMQLSMELQGYLAIARMAADSAGVPPKLLDGVSISSSGSTVTATLSVSYAELKQAAKNAGL